MTNKPRPRPFLTAALLLLIALPLRAQSITEQLAQVAREHARYNPIIMHEGDTVIFTHRLRRPGTTTAHLYDLTREALLETFGEIPSGALVTNGHDRLLLRTRSTVEGTTGTARTRSAVDLLFSVVIRSDTLYTTVRFFTLTVSAEAPATAYTAARSVVNVYPLTSFYPLNPAKARDNPLASWVSLRVHYADIWQHLAIFERAIINADPYLPE